MNYIDKILDYYTGMGIEKRMGSFIDQIGFEIFRQNVLKN
jgi:dissimilatory sulfite reductase (desulfoviridin) alpha/beta subunit